MIRNIYLFTILLIISFGILGCVKDKPPHDSKEFKLPPLNEGVLIINEGSLGLGNASLSVFDKQSLQIYHNVFEEVNNMPMGDIFQSAYQINKQLYLLMNNSDEILVVDAQNFELQKRIEVKKPRNMLKIDDNTAYITSLFNNQIYILNTNTLEIQDSISIPYENSEQLIQFGNHVYVCNWNSSSSYLYKINIHSHQLVEAIDLGVYASHGIIKDANEHLWIFSGQPHDQIPAAITVLNPNNNTIIKQRVFDGIAEMMKPVTNTTEDTIYYLGVDYDGGTKGNGVFYSSINEEDIVRHPFILANNFQYYWGLAYDKQKKHLYIADPKGFIQKGKLSIYTPNKELFFETSTGIGPGNFLFLND